MLTWCSPGLVLSSLFFSLITLIVDLRQALDFNHCSVTSKFIPPVLASPLFFTQLPSSISFCMFNVCLKFNFPISLIGPTEIHRNKTNNSDGPDWLMLAHIKNPHLLYEELNFSSFIKGIRSLPHCYWEVFQLSTNHLI